MPTFSIRAVDKPGNSELRALTRPVHLEHLERFAKEIVAAGALLDAGLVPVGSLLIVDMTDCEAVEMFMAADPYTKAGLFVEVDIQSIRLVYPATQVRSTMRSD